MAPALAMAIPATCIMQATSARSLINQHCKISAPFRSGRVMAPRPLKAHRRAPTAPRAGLLDFFTGGSAPKSSPQRDELVQALYEAVEGTQAGLKATGNTREQIAELVEQLGRYSVRSPTRSDLFWGEWEIVYCSNPTAPGGPFRSTPGRALFANQRIRQSLQKPGTLINIVEFKTLGLLPGSTQQIGDLQIIDGQRYRVNLSKPAIAVVGKATAKAPAPDAGTGRSFRTLYLDESFRVAQFEPEEEGRQPTLFVFQRMTAEEEQEAAQEEDEEEIAPVVPARRRRGSAAAEQEEAGPQSGTRRVGRRVSWGRQQQEKEGVEEEEAALQPAAKMGFQDIFDAFGGARKQAGSQTSAAASSTSRAEQQARRAELQSGISEFAEAVKEAAAGSRQQSQALKASEREVAELLRGAALPRSQLEKARSSVAAVLAELEEAQEEERRAASRVRSSAAEIKELERASGALR